MLKILLMICTLLLSPSFSYANYGDFHHNQAYHNRGTFEAYHRYDRYFHGNRSPYSYYQWSNPMVIISTPNGNYYGQLYYPTCTETKTCYDGGRCVIQEVCS